MVLIHGSDHYSRNAGMTGFGRHKGVFGGRQACRVLGVSQSTPFETAQAAISGGLFS